MSPDTLLLIAVLLGAFCGAFFLFRNANGTYAFLSIVLTKLRPVILSYMLKRMSPEKEQEFRDCMRRGGVWDFHRKRCKL